MIDSVFYFQLKVLHCMIVPTGQKSKLGFYFHIPFCPHICPYCDFVKTSKFLKKDIDVYFNSLEEQLNHFLNLLPNEYKNCWATIYFGGGTPGLFDAKFYLPLINILKKHYEFEEVTLETNPLTNIQRQLQNYFSIGINRLTLGAQSLCPQTLKTLGRKHTKDTIFKNIQWAKESGFKNIQIDLIYGLKNNTRTIPIQQEIEMLFHAGATGISAYALTLEKRTLFANSNFTDENVAAQEYFSILKTCNEIGFTQHETSNFSNQDTFHNNIYWYGLPYIGIGTGAHGLLPPSKETPYGIRYKIGSEFNSTYAPGNDRLLFSNKNELGKNFHIHYDNPRTKQEYVKEMMFTLLRTPKGIPLLWLSKILENEEIKNKISQNSKIKRGIKEGKILLDNHYFALTAEEKIRGDAWLADLLTYNIQ